MAYFDVFNGDADGICALLQLRFEQPRESILVTGVKRDIQLLERVDAGCEDEVTVLDISMAKNTQPLKRLLKLGTKVFYADHHMPGEIPGHRNLEHHIDTDPNTCTSLIIDRLLGGKYREWAITAAFGDNMTQSAIGHAKDLSLSGVELEQLELLGICINYNGYGQSLDDLHFHPDQLYLALRAYHSPLDFIRDQDSLFGRLKDGYFDDLACAEATTAEFENEVAAVFILPDAPWSRRISGVFGNQLANQNPKRAHAILSHNGSGGYTVSVRAPLADKRGADELCSSFPTGGGRKSAAGINHLPSEQVGIFIERLVDTYKG
jgi:hypothetical protein